MEATQNTETVHPLRAAVEAAEARCAAAEAAFDALGEEPPDSCPEGFEIATADDALEVARQAIIGSGCPRLWDLSEDGHMYDSIVATSAGDALETARDNVDRGNYNDVEGTFWVDVRVHCRETDESASDTVQCDEDEPGCSGSEHDWQSPIELVGGIKENPGVWGKGGGVVITEVCMCCGCKRTTDTWAQRPDTGQQGLTSVSYDQAAFSPDELAAAAE